MLPRLVLPLAKALNPGERWITVHPPGHDKGQPVLVQEHPDHTATVIGGAGGSLNHLVLRGIKSKGDYAAEVREGQQQRQAAKREAEARDRELGIHEAKQDARAALRVELSAQRTAFVAAVAKLAGWDEATLHFDEAAHAGLSPAALAKARVQHERKLFAAAKAEVEINRRRLVEDADARAASGLGEVPMLAPSPEQLDVRDLDPMPEKVAGLGFDPAYKARAEAVGLSTADLAAEVAEVSRAGKDPEAIAAASAKAVAIASSSAAIAQELQAFTASNPDTKAPNPGLVAEAHKAADLVRALKKLRLAEQKAKSAAAEIDASTKAVEPKAFVLEVAPAEVEAAAAAAVEDDLRTAQVRSFLSEVGKLGGTESLGGNLVNGAYNALNAAAMAVGGTTLLDRSVVDVLGLSGAAQVLARRFRAGLSPEAAEKTRDALAEYHVARCTELQTSALAEAQKLHDAAAAIEVPDAVSGQDLAVAQEVNDRRRKCIQEARRVVGNALGEMQASASLVAALEGDPAKVEVALGSGPLAGAITKLRALGLQKGDYALEPVGGTILATINAAGMDRLARPFDPSGQAQVRRNLDIIEGKFDEPDWLPQGFAKRPDLAMKVDPGVAPRLALPFLGGAGGPNPAPGDLPGLLRDYIGGRTADGDAPADILADIQSHAFVERSGDSAAYRAALDAVAPIKAEDGSLRPIESLAPAFEGYADAFVESHYGTTRTALHRQSFAVDEVSADALHRALAAVPEGVAAMRPIGELTAKDRTGLRRWWYANVAKEPPEQAEARAALEQLEGEEPAKTSTDMFGEQATTAEWSAWDQQRKELAAKVNAGAFNWSHYVGLMGSPEKAIATTQDLVRSRLVERFADAYNRLHPDAPLKVGKTVVAGNLAHLDAVDPAARAKRQAQQAALVDSLRERIGGKYAAGAVSDKLAAAKAADKALEQAQMGFFASEEPAAGATATLAADERYTLGHAAEQKLAGMMSVVGQNFRPGQPVRIWSPTMSGGKAAARQRLIKLLVANKRVMAAFGTGSGKTALQLAGFTELHGLGKAKKGIMVVPGQVVGQFGSDALRYLEPGKFKWMADPGASREQRIASYKDPATHFSVVTHQAFRDDMVYLGAQQAGVDEAAMEANIAAMTEPQRAAWAKEVMAGAGIPFDYLTTDESQFTLNRAGKENSRLANVVDAFSANIPYYMPSSGDPVKNDASEVFDLFHKMDPARYRDRAGFLRQYGGDTVASKAALQREMARYFYPSRIDPDVHAERSEETVPLSGEQQAALAGLSRNVARLRVARMSGTVDVAAAKVVSPRSFDGVSEADAPKVAEALQKAVGMVKAAAERRIINEHPSAGKLERVLALAGERSGKPGVVFAHSRAAVEQLRAKLEAAGHKVVTITGSDSPEEKDRKRLAFAPESGAPTADILVASDAGATGLNLQRGQWLVEYDTPDTAMVHGQRQGRIFRTGQKQDVELIDLVGDHRSERRARERLHKKYGLRELMTSPMDGLDDSGLAHFLHARGVYDGIAAGATA